MRYGDTTRLGRPFAKDPAVVRFDDRYFLYYSIPPVPPELTKPDSPKGWGIGIAESRDLINWKRIGELPGVSEGEEASGFCAPGARVIDGKVHLFYQTYTRSPHDALCHAVSIDGVHFERNPSNPILRTLGNWSNGRAIDADVIQWNGQWMMYYSSRDPEGKVQMSCVATTPLGSDFGRESWTQHTINGPILKPELPWETKCIEAMALCEHDGRLFMFYAGGYNNEPQQIGCAVSDDGFKFTRVSDQPILPNGAPGSWNSSESGHPFILQDGDQYHLFFQGNNDNGHTWLLSRKTIHWKDGAPYILSAL